MVRGRGVGPAHRVAAVSGQLESFPVKRTGDRIQDLALIVVSAVPGIGGPLELFLERVIGPSHGRRLEAFIRTTADAVRELQSRGVDVEELPNNDAWITTVIRASRVAAGTHLEEKLRLLRAAIVNAALPDAPADFLTMRFLGFIEDLSPEHFLLLEYGRDPVSWYERKGIARETVHGPRTYALERAELGLDSGWQGLVIKDLADETLVQGSMLSGMVTPISM